MSVKIGINGFGRIGKLVFRLAYDLPGFKIVQVNDKMPIELLAHLLKYDSLHGRFKAEISHDKDHLTINDQKILVTNSAEPAKINWPQTGVDIVIESSGKFKTRKSLEGHLRKTVRKVILTCPASDDSIDRTIVMGVNHKTIQAADRIISNASCTTNCVAVILKVLKEEFGLKRSFLNTVHPATNNQNLQDGFHSDFRRARSALNNIIPTTTSAIEAVKLIFPELKNRFDGFATRVPVADCSFVELTAQLSGNVQPVDINSAFQSYARCSLNGYLEYADEPLVSSDINDNPHSAVFDSLATKVLAGDLIQIIAWYDNESGYSNRIIDLLKYLA